MRFLMSVEAITWAFSVQNLSSSMKLVLIALADNADQDFKCWPAVETISKKTCLSERAVHANLVKLVDAGLLKKEQRFNKNGQTSNMYYLQKGMNEVHTPPARGAVTPLHEIHPPPARGADEPSINHQLKPSIKYTSDFELFWNEYPRKMDKKGAFEKYKTALKQTTPENLVKKARAYRIHCEREKTEMRFIKHPKTWLNNASWENNYSSVIKKQKSKDQMSHNEFQAMIDKQIAGIKNGTV